MISTLAIAALGAGASAQSINIDFGNENGSPPDTFAAAGLPGVWNVITTNLETPVALVDLDGNPTTVTIAAELAFGTLGDIPLPHPELPDDIQPLLGDGLLGAHGPGITMPMSIEGLENGEYRIITYTWYWPADAFGMAVFFEDSAFAFPAGGPWPGQLALGVTHMVHHITVLDGTINLETVGAGPGASFNGDNLINGMQIWQLAPGGSCPADFTRDGDVGAADLGQMLATWGQCPVPPGECPADLDDNEQVGPADLGGLLAAWGPCLGLPVNCSQPELGDCYVAHVGQGCSEPECCTAICALDNYCCINEWDSLCAGLANVLVESCPGGTHPNCGNPRAGSCFVPNIPATPGCDDTECCHAVCFVDQFCCQFAWDNLCAEEAGMVCGKGD
jgi:hypothetical protein